MTRKSPPSSRGGTRSAPARKKDRKKIPVTAIVFIGLAILIVAAVALTGGNSLTDQERVALVAGDVTIDGTSLSPYSPGATDSSIGVMAPEATGVDFNDQTVQITHDGRPKMVLFLAHWCPHCQAEVPRVQAWLNDTGGVPGVDIVAVVTGYDPPRGNWPPQDWLQREGWTPPVLRDNASSDLYVAYGAGGFPYFVFIRADGTVAYRTSGEQAISDVEAEMLSLVQ